MKPVAAILLKAPRPGEIKTRLAAAIGDGPAAEIYRTMVAHQLAQIPDGWVISIHYSPPDAGSEMRTWLEPILAGRAASFVSQVEGDLGRRLTAVVGHELACGVGPVALIGGDCPALSRDYLKRAESLARRKDLVIGPACDGGYVLLILRAFHPDVFRGIEWSTPHVLEQTIQTARALGLEVGLLEPLEDVDDRPSFQRNEHLLRAGRSA